MRYAVDPALLYNVVWHTHPTNQSLPSTIFATSIWSGNFISVASNSAVYFTKVFLLSVKLHHEVSFFLCISYCFPFSRWDLFFLNRAIIVQIALQCKTIIFCQMSKYSQLNTVSEPVPIQKFNNRPEEGIQFFKRETNRLLLENYSLNAKLITSLEEKKQLADRIFELEKNSNESQEDKKKRHRRCANQIKRDFICKAEKCGKSYGSEGSLAQHVRLKHPELMPLQSESQERS